MPASSVAVISMPHMLATHLQRFFDIFVVPIFDKINSKTHIMDS